VIIRQLQQLRTASSSASNDSIKIVLTTSLETIAGKLHCLA
jgi:hypothetical protein